MKRIVALKKEEDTNKQKTWNLLSSLYWWDGENWVMEMTGQFNFSLSVNLSHLAFWTPDPFNFIPHCYHSCPLPCHTVLSSCQHFQLLTHSTSFLTYCSRPLLCHTVLSSCQHFQLLTHSTSFLTVTVVVPCSVKLSCRHANISILWHIQLNSSLLQSLSPTLSSSLCPVIVPSFPHRNLSKMSIFFLFWGPSFSLPL